MKRKSEGTENDKSTKKNKLNPRPKNRIKNLEKVDVEMESKIFSLI
jgi:hypothetical protein